MSQMEGQQEPRLRGVSVSVVVKGWRGSCMAGAEAAMREGRPGGLASSRACQPWARWKQLEDLNGRMRFTPCLDIFNGKDTEAESWRDAPRSGSASPTSAVVSSHG